MWSRKAHSKNHYLTKWAAGFWRPVVFVVALVLLWWLVTAQQWVVPFILPSPQDTLNALTGNGI
ncbi:hypothetical protein [Pseudarthrobacter sulfonivorans]|uniref:hypothetical protein n=1 Tax=Pseudarthrobacter sulfonivorans TaxID=121292 RepID=UPI002105C4FB|nr:hypothetical protein [Pseudarthrobacter sulfonivorans]